MKNDRHEADGPTQILWSEYTTIDTGHPHNVLRVMRGDSIDGLHMMVTARGSDQLRCGECGKTHEMGLTRPTLIALRDVLTRWLEVSS